VRVNIGGLPNEQTWFFPHELSDEEDKKDAEDELDDDSDDDFDEDLENNDGKSEEMKEFTITAEVADVWTDIIHGATTLISGNDGGSNN